MNETASSESPFPSASFRCGSCGKEVFSNGEAEFICPFCGSEIVIGGQSSETPEEKCRRLEREAERLRLRAEIGQQAATDWCWRNPLALFSGLDRSAARNALENGDLEAAKRHLKAAKKTSGLGFMVFVLLFVVILVLAFLFKK